MPKTNLFSNSVHIQGTNYTYFSDRKLGEGYGGVIYEGVDVSKNQRIAIKIQNRNSRVENQITNKQMLRIASSEKYTHADFQLYKNRLVTIIDIIQMDKTLFIMQLCQCNLKQFLYQRNQLNQIQILKILKEIVEGLLLIDNQGYHLADLKPENILISDNQSAKLGDLQSLIKLTFNDNCKLKFKQQIFGTLHYMPPELMQFGQYGRHNYIWTLGVILHQMVYGQLPFLVQDEKPNPTPQEKRKYMAEFYKSLFNLKIRQDFAASYPKSQILIRNMLRFSEKKRISLEKLYQFLINQDLNLKILNGDIHSTLTQKNTSSSHITADTSFNEEFTIETEDTSFNMKINSIKSFTNSNLLISLNQKQTQNPLWGSEPLENDKTTKKIQLMSQEEKESCDGLMENQFFREAFVLMEQIKNPLVLVRKLDELKRSLIEQMSRPLKRKDLSLKAIKIFEDCLQAIRSSRAYSHLQKTAKYSVCEKDRQLNMKELNLWNHFNSLISKFNNNPAVDQT